MLQHRIRPNGEEAVEHAIARGCQPVFALERLWVLDRAGVRTRTGPGDRFRTGKGIDDDILRRELLTSGQHLPPRRRELGRSVKPPDSLLPGISPPGRFT